MQIEIGSKGFFTNIQQFKFIKDIGVGSFGKVRLAVHRGTRKHYAIKTIQINSQTRQEQLKIIVRQIKVHFKLDHPHIIKLWDTIIESNKIYMIMDYAKNGSLFRYHSGILQEGNQVDSNKVYQFFFQTFQAIKYLHSHDLMHRDIKPQNLLLDQEFNIKLCDFGWATNQIASPRSTFCGTYQYMAPQMVLQKSYDFKIDIWALGILLYQLIHGKAPFQGQSLKTIKQKICRGSYQIDGVCSNSLKNLIIEILQFNPQKRLSLKDIEKHEWIKQNFTKVQQVIKVQTNLSKKHMHQKSLGNFQGQAHKKYLNDININSNDVLKHKLNLYDEQASSNYLNLTSINENNINKNDVLKKHKRNITQSQNLDLFQKQEEYKTRIPLNQRVQMALNSVSTDSNTPPTNGFEQIQSILYQNHNNNLQSQKCGLQLNYKHKSNNQASNMKCKTQIDQHLTKPENQANILGSRKNLLNISNQGQQSLILKKRRVNLVTQGPVNGHIYQNHFRHVSSGQLKQNQIITNQNMNTIARQKAKKKSKLCQKTNTNIQGNFTASQQGLNSNQNMVSINKVKRLQQKFNQISNKFAVQKRQFDRFMNS